MCSKTKQRITLPLLIQIVAILPELFEFRKENDSFEIWPFTVLPRTAVKAHTLPFAVKYS